MTRWEQSRLRIKKGHARRKVDAACSQRVKSDTWKYKSTRSYWAYNEPGDPVMYYCRRKVWRRIGSMWYCKRHAWQLSEVYTQDPRMRFIVKNYNLLKEMKKNDKEWYMEELMRELRGTGH